MINYKATVLFLALVTHCVSLPLYANTSQTDIDRMVGKAPVRNPLFAFHFLLSPNGLGTADFSIKGATQHAPTTASMGKFVAAIGLDVQPLHLLGVWGAGPTFDVYVPFSKIGGQPSPLTYAYSFGGEVRYQARYWESQPLVPTVSYAWKYMNYRTSPGTLGGLPLQEPAVGLWLNLNWIDPEITRSIRQDLGIQRSYLMVEYRRFIPGVGLDETLVSLSGELIQTGLRFEF